MYSFACVNLDIACTKETRALLAYGLIAYFAKSCLIRVRGQGSILMDPTSYWFDVVAFLRDSGWSEDKIKDLK